MTAHLRLKIAVDLAMTVALMLLMPYELLGQSAHEWIGMVMLVLFIGHHILNKSWIINLSKGCWTALRVWQTVLVVAVLTCMLGSMVSGIVLSHTVFAFFPMHGGQSWARTMHLLCAYWGFVIMSAHIGFHSEMMTAAIKRNARGFTPKTSKLLRVAALCFAAYGVIAFFKRGFPDYMFLRTEFVLFNYEEPIGFFFIDYVAVMVLFDGLSHCVSLFLKSQSQHGLRLRK